MSAVRRGNFVNGGGGLDARHKRAAEFHGVAQRWRDLEAQCGLCVASKALLPHYKAQKEGLEEAEALLSVTAGEDGRQIAGMVTSVESGETEYFTSRCPAGWSRGRKELHALKTALEVWGGTVLGSGPVAVVTTADEVFALMSYGHQNSSASDDLKQTLRDMQENLQKHRLTATVISMTRNRTLDWILEAEDRAEAKQQMLNLHERLFDGKPPTKVDYRRRTDDARDD